MRYRIVGLLALMACTSANAGMLHNGAWLQGLTEYSETGHVPDTAFWQHLEARHAINPARFDHYHPQLEGIFSPPHCVGLLPEGRFWEKLEHRYEVNPVRFDHYHPYLATIMARNEATELTCYVTPPPFTPPAPPPFTPPTPPLPPVPPIPPPVVPEPSSFTIASTGLLVIAIVMLHSAYFKKATPAAICDATDAATCPATREATAAATDYATHAATTDATDTATRAATDGATYIATAEATRTATDVATREATYDAADDATIVRTKQ